MDASFFGVNITGAKLVLRKLLAFGLFCFMLLAACGGLTPDPIPELVEPRTAVQGVLATAAPKRATALPIIVTIAPKAATATMVPAATQTVPAATQVFAATTVPRRGFSDLRFALTPDGAAQREFAPGTEEVYAVWEYTGMSPTDSIRRIWFRDDQIWLTREEGWNWSEYGSEGTMRDISVYDNEGSGLPPATYRLQLYINDDLQQEAMFVVLAP
jgi:hypothetical protein